MVKWEWLNLILTKGIIGTQRAQGRALTKGCGEMAITAVSKTAFLSSSLSNPADKIIS